MHHFSSAIPFLRPGPLPKNNLDFLRFGLAVLVVFSHSFPLATGSYGGEPLWAVTGRLSWEQMSFGWIAVNFFFVLSGFLITHSWLNSRGTVDYLRKRVLRIYPAFVVATLMCIFLVAPCGAPNVGDYFQSLNLREVVGMTSLLRGYEAPDLFGSLPFPKAVNGSLWTIQYEFWCYLLVLLCGVLGALRHRMGVLVLLAGALVLYGAQLRCEWQADIGYAEKFLAGPQEWPRLLTYFSAGMAFYRWRHRVPRSWWLVAGSVVGLAVAALCGKAIFLGLPVFGTYLFFFLAFRPLPRITNFGRFGDFSYGIYLYSFPIQQLLMQHFGGVTAPLKLFLVALPLTLVVAVGSWYLIEKPFLKLKSRARVKGLKAGSAPTSSEPMEPALGLAPAAAE